MGQALCCLKFQSGTSRYHFLGWAFPISRLEYLLLFHGKGSKRGGFFSWRANALTSPMIGINGEQNLLLPGWPHYQKQSPDKNQKAIISVTLFHVTSIHFGFTVKMVITHCHTLSVVISRSCGAVDRVQKKKHAKLYRRREFFSQKPCGKKTNLQRAF